MNAFTQLRQQRARLPQVLSIPRPGDTAPSGYTFAHRKLRLPMGHRDEERSVANANVYHAIRHASKRAIRGGLAEVHVGDTQDPVSESQLSSDHTRRVIRGLLKNKTLAEALDPLLEVTALREGMIISTIHKLISYKADEEAEAYLKHTLGTWEKIVNGGENLSKLVARDVEELQLRCPRFCTDDAQIISKLIKQGSIFQAFQESERAAIEKKIFEIDTLIPSLYTFSRDANLLGALAASMKHIVSPKKKTIRQALLSSRPEHLSISDAYDGIRELWAFMLQNHPSMPHPKVNTDPKLRAGPLAQPSHQAVVYRAGRLALQRGFKTAEARLAAGCDHSDEGFATPIQNAHSFPAPSADPVVQIQKDWVVKDSPDNREGRCGRPREEAFRLCQSLLTWTNLQANMGNLHVQGRGLTTFFTLRCQFLAFFGSSGGSVTSPPSPVASIRCPEPFWLCHIPLMRNSFSSSARFSGSEYSSSEHSARDGHAVPPADSSFVSVSVPESPEIGGETVSGETGGGGGVRGSRFLFVKFDPDPDKRSFGEEIWIDADGESIEEVAAEFILQKWVLFSTTASPLLPEDCREMALTGSLNTVILVPRERVWIDHEFKQLARGLQATRPL